MTAAPIQLPHSCPWIDQALKLRQLVEQQQALLAQAQQMLQALSTRIRDLEQKQSKPKSEKLKVTPVGGELDAEEAKDPEADKEMTRKRRRARQQQRQQLQTQLIMHPVPPEQQRCPQCGNTQLGWVGEGKQTVTYEYVPGSFVRQVHVQQTLSCRCGGYIVTAPPPPKPIDKGQYGPGVVAHAVVGKCADSLPLYRQAKAYQRLGIPMARSTLCDLFHGAAQRLEPLSRRLVELIAQADVVQADETPLKMQAPDQRGYVWTFLHDELIGYRFSADRSGQTPQQVLGGTRGTLVVDAYTGYNRVMAVDGRQRAGCLAHARRKFFEAQSSSPQQARQALELILDVYRVEHAAKERGIVRTAEHLRLRQTQGRAAMDRFHQWLREQQGLHPPKSPLGEAIRYALNQWEALTRFLDDARVPVDNNASERALRVVALGRKNFLFVGHKEAGDRLAGLYSLVATCEANGVDPVAYLADVLLRVDTHPAARIDELLPHKWTPPATQSRQGAAEQRAA